MLEIEKIQKALEDLANEMGNTNITRGLRVQVYEGFLQRLRFCSNALREVIEEQQVADDLK